MNCNHALVVMNYHYTILARSDVSPAMQALMEVERDLNEAATMQSGLSAEEKQQHIAEVEELKVEIASQAAATARLRHSLEQRSDIIERLTANDVHQQEKINLLKVGACHMIQPVI